MGGKARGGSSSFQSTGRGAVSTGGGRGGASTSGAKPGLPKPAQSEQPSIKEQLAAILQRLTAMESSRENSELIARLGAVEEAVQRSVQLSQDKTPSYDADSPDCFVASHDDVASHVAHGNTQRKSKRKRTQYKPLDMTTIFSSINYDEYFQITFSKEDKTSLNPFDVIASISSNTNYSPSKLFSANKKSFIVQIKDEIASKKLMSLTNIAGKTCAITSYDRFNRSRGLIYVHNSHIPDLDEFKTALSDDRVVDIERAPFIKTREPTTQAFILTFQGKTLPFSIYIPGESQDTRIIPFGSRPMMCKTCQSYGHTNKRCSAEKPICRQCGGLHKINKESPCSAPPQCYHCKGDHPAGHRNCPRHQRETQLVKLQETEGVSFRRAIQIMSGHADYQEQVQASGPSFSTHFNITLLGEDTPKFSPWCLEKCLSQHLQRKPIIRSKSGKKQQYIVEIENKTESEKMKKLTDINGCPVEVTECHNSNLSKGLIYIHDYDMSDFGGFARGLRDKCDVVEAIEAKWIKTRNQATKPLLVSFSKTEIPNFLNIPGEQARTPVNEYKEKPLMCKRCLCFGHSFKYCESEFVCGKCAETGHQRSDCQSPAIVCHHCEENHYTGSNKCQIAKCEQEVLHIQRKERVSKAQARLLFHQRNPNFGGQTYSSVLQKKPDTQNNSKKRQRPEDQSQEDQSPQHDQNSSVAASPTKQPPQKQPMVGNMCHLIVKSPGGTYRKRTFSLDNQYRSPHPTQSEVQETREIFNKYNRDSDMFDSTDEDVRQYEQDLSASQPSDSFQPANSSRRSRESRRRQHSSSRRKHSQSHARSSAPSKDHRSRDDERHSRSRSRSPHK